MKTEDEDQPMGAKKQALITDAALSLAAVEGWRGLTLAAIAAEADLPLRELYRNVRSKTDILIALSRRIDMAVADAMNGPQEPEARDRLFDAAMARFDALLPHKQGAAAIYTDVKRDPAAVAALLKPYLKSCEWTLEAAGVSAAGLKGRVRVKAFAWVLRQSFLVWLNDDAGQSKTMADLDQRLRRAERLFEDGRKPSADPTQMGEA